MDVTQCDQLVADLIAERAASAAHTATAYHRLRGDVVHACIGEVLPVWATDGLTAARAAVPAIVDAHVRSRSFGRLNRARIQVAGMVYRYLAQFLPGEQAALLGAEITVADGRIDLIWRHPHVGVFFDELKTGAAQYLNQDPDTLQAARYVAAGNATYRDTRSTGTDGGCDTFAGVRLINLRTPTASRHFAPDGSTTALHISPLDIAHLR